MAITVADVKLVKSKVMLDVPEGGGPPSPNIVQDATSNSIFPDISELDRAAGRVNMRKLFATVQTNDTDSYYGANVIVAEPPQDPRVAVTLFSTESTFDNRNNASSRVESYLTSGPEWDGFLFENHLAGQRIIQICQRPSATLPAIGQTLVIVENEGAGNQKLQYVRATTITSELRTFGSVLGGGTFQGLVVSVEISDALRYDFTGSPPNSSFVRASNGAKIRDTIVADAGTYVGIVPLTQAANLGDFTIKCESIYTQLVPSAQTETPISFANPYAAAAVPVPGPAPVTFTTGAAWTDTTSLNLPGGVLPGSLTITTDGLNIFDEGGILKTTSSQLGTVDYSNGNLKLNSGSLSNSKTITYKPAALLLRAPQSTEIPVTAETRSQSYVGIVVPVPQPATLSVSYMVQGRWYTLSENGKGAIKGLDASFGAGTFNSETGAFVVTLGALPDVDTSIIIAWNVPTQETIHPSINIKAKQTVQLNPPPGKSIQVGSLQLEWTYNGAKTATVNTAGQLQGDATGILNVTQATVEFAPNVLPAVGTIVTANYVSGPKQQDDFVMPARNGQGQLPITASLGSIIPGSVEVEWNTETDLNVISLFTRRQLIEMGIPVPFALDPIHFAYDDGVGNLKYLGANIGTINYATGLVTFQPDTSTTAVVPVYNTPVAVAGTGFFRLPYGGMQYITAASLFPVGPAGWVKLRYNSAGATNNETETFTVDPDFKLVPGVDAQIVPGSVLLNVISQGIFWGDNYSGTLRESTGSGYVTRGTIDYLTGKVQLTSWIAGTTNNFARSACTTTVGENISSEYIFRTSAAPLRPGSFSIHYASTESGTATLTANSNGELTGPGVFGYVNYDTGLAKIRFGDYVPAAGNEGEPFYDPDLINEDGDIFKPVPVVASTVKYSAVAFSYLPLDADIIGIDPVRLPTDGRVPIFRKGSFAVVGHTGTVGPLTVVNGQVVNCNRVRLSRVRVIGNNGQIITNGYTADLEAGTVAFVNVAGYSQPVRIEHRIEDMALVSDLQISGELSFTRPLTHSYPFPGSYVSSALVAGDLQARVSVIFDQNTWNGTWSDNISGSSATGTYNDINSPIQVTNKGAVTERWAIVFTNSTSFNVIGENVGVIATGNTSTDCGPLNPATNAPYFLIPFTGWGLGWAVGNVLRFNTVGSEFPIWVVRTILQGPETVPNDNFTLLIRGDVDQP